MKQTPDVCLFGRILGTHAFLRRTAFSGRMHTLRLRSSIFCRAVKPAMRDRAAVTVTRFPQHPPISDEAPALL